MPIVDLDVYGRTNPDGNPKVHSGDTAISNALVLYLTSRKGDFINNPNFGGPMEFMLFKGLNQDTNLIEQKMREEIEAIFSGLLQIELISVEPDFQGRQWVVDIYYRSLSTNDINAVRYYANTTASNYAPQERFKPNIFIDVPYTDENLLNFIMLKKSEIPNEKILKNETDGFFYWGYYRLINFNENDPLFEQIITLVNGSFNFQVNERDDEIIYHITKNDI